MRIYLSIYVCSTGSLAEYGQSMEAAIGFNIDAKNLEERIIAQMVFTEEIIPGKLQRILQFL